jgi:hypothetical protein
MPRPQGRPDALADREAQRLPGDDAVIRAELALPAARVSLWPIFYTALKNSLLNHRLGSAGWA